MNHSAVTSVPFGSVWGRRWVIAAPARSAERCMAWLSEEVPRMSDGYPSAHAARDAAVIMSTPRPAPRADGPSQQPSEA